MHLRSVLTAVGLVAALASAPAHAGDQKRVLTETEMGNVTAGIYVFATGLQRIFFLSLADPLFGRQVDTDTCGSCTGFSVEIGTGIAGGGQRVFLRYPFSQEQ